MPTNEIEKAWRKAQAAWEAAGKPLPCYDAAYMAARAELAAAWQRACVVRGRACEKIGPLSKTCQGGLPVVSTGYDRNWINNGDS